MVYLDRNNFYDDSCSCCGVNFRDKACYDKSPALSGKATIFESIFFTLCEYGSVY